MDEKQWEVLMRECQSCGQPAGVRVNGKDRVYCDTPECQSAQRSDASRGGWERFRQRKVKLCPACGKWKKIATEWRINSRHGSDGKLRRFVPPYCIDCTRAIARARYQSNAEYRRRQKERAAASRAKQNARRAVDPAYDAEIRAKHAAQERARKQRGPRQSESQREPHPILDGAPFRDWLRHIAVRFDTTYDMSVALGCDDSGLQHVMSGSRQRVREDLVDRVGVNIGEPGLLRDLYPELWG